MRSILRRPRQPDHPPLHAYESELQMLPVSECLYMGVCVCVDGCVCVCVSV